MKKPDEVSVNVAGDIIEELSSKIPSNIFALNELVKNSYDAFARNININIDLKENKLVISDDGLGMSRESIEELFHIAKSSKRYGEKKKHDGLERYVQGSKGLGILAVYKFGDVVEWDTVSNGVSYKFSASKSDLVSMQNITDYKVSVRRGKAVKLGTKITIHASEVALRSLIKYFSDEKNSLKLVGAFTDDGVDIKLELPSVSILSSKSIVKLPEINPTDQFLFVRYDSNAEEVLFFHHGEVVEKKRFSLSVNGYHVKAELMVYSLASYGKKKITSYFYREPDEALTPLLFINDNLFNNYAVFDTNIFRQRKSGMALPQIIGYINLYSTNPSMDFNSDRTNFVENEFTDAIKEDLRRLNEVVQETGVGIKNNIKDGIEKGPGGKARKPLTGAAFPTGTTTSNSESNENFRPSYINIDEAMLVYKVPSAQIDLYGLILEAKNSKGLDVKFEDISIYVDGKKCAGSVLSSVDVPCERELVFKYTDSGTGEVVASTILKFIEKKSPISGSVESNNLFWLPSDENYQVSIPHVATIIAQVSRAHSYKGQYTALIASSLRTVFELSVDAVEKKYSKVFSHKKPPNIKGGLSWRVVQLIVFLKANKPLCKEVSGFLYIEYNTFVNMLDKVGFNEAVDGANLGAHKSLSHLTETRISSVAKYSGFVAAFCDVLITKVLESTITSSQLAIDADFV